MRKRSTKIGIIGRIDPDGALYDGQTVKTRTIYGPVDHTYEREFFGLVGSCENVRYCGCARPEASVEAIKARQIERNRDGKFAQRSVGDGRG